MRGEVREQALCLVDAIDLQYPLTLRHPASLAHAPSHDTISQLCLLPHLLRDQLRHIVLPHGLPAHALASVITSLVTAAPRVEELSLHDGGCVDDVTAFNCGSLPALHTLRVAAPSDTLLSFLMAPALFRSLLHLELAAVADAALSTLVNVFQVRALREQEHHNHNEGSTPPPPPLHDLSLAFAGGRDGMFSPFSRFLDYVKGAAVSDFGALRHMSLDLDYATSKLLVSSLLSKERRRPSLETRGAIELLRRTRSALTPVFPLSTALSVGVHPHCNTTSRVPGGERLAAFGRVQYVDEFVDDSNGGGDGDEGGAGVAVISGILHSHTKQSRMDVEWVERQFKRDGPRILCCSVRLGPGLVNMLANVDTLVLRCVRSMAAALAEQHGRRGYLLASYLSKCTRVRRVVLFAPTDAWDVHGEDEEDEYSATDRAAMLALEGNINGDDELRPDGDGLRGDEDDKPKEKRIKYESPKGNTADVNILNYIDYFSRTSEAHNVAAAIFGTSEVHNVASAILPSSKDKDALASHGITHTIVATAPKTNITVTPTAGTSDKTAVTEPATFPVPMRYDRGSRPVVDRGLPEWWVPLSRRKSLTDDQLIGLAAALGELRGLDTLELGQKWFLCMVGRLHCVEDVYASMLAKLPRVRTLHLACGEMWRRTSLDMAAVARLAKGVAQLLRAVADRRDRNERKNDGEGSATLTDNEVRMDRQLECVFMDGGYFGCTGDGGGGVPDGQERRAPWHDEWFTGCGVGVSGESERRKERAAVDQSVTELEHALRLYDNSGSTLSGGGGKVLPDVSTIRGNCEQLRVSLILSK